MPLMHVAAERARCAGSKFTGLGALYSDDACKWMQIERDSGNRLCLRGIELPDEEMGIWKIFGQKSESRNQAGPGPSAMLIAFNFDFEHIARLGVSDSDRTGERMHLEWIELGLEVRHRPSRLNLVPAGIRHPQGNAVTWGKGGPGRDRVIPTIDENRIVEVVMRIYQRFKYIWRSNYKPRDQRRGLRVPSLVFEPQVARKFGYVEVLSNRFSVFVRASLKSA